MPGVNLNISSSGIGLNVGVKGANISIGNKGTYLNTGVPGTGVSKRTKIGGGSKSTKNQKQETDNSNIDSSIFAGQNVYLVPQTFSFAQTLTINDIIAGVDGRVARKLTNNVNFVLIGYGHDATPELINQVTDLNNKGAEINIVKLQEPLPVSKKSEDTIVKIWVTLIIIVCTIIAWIIIM